MTTMDTLDLAEKGEMGVMTHIVIVPPLVRQNCHPNLLSEIRRLLKI